MIYTKNNQGTDETWKRIPSGSIGVELGVWKGGSSAKFLKNASFLHLVDAWSIEPYKGSDENGGWEGYLKKYSDLVVGSKDPNEFQKYYDGIYADVCKKFKDKPVKIWRMSTDKFFEQFDQKVDWVYVDAAHSYEGCLYDLRKSLTIIKPGGSIFGDDYGNKKGVVRAVDEFIQETGLQLDNFYKNQIEIKV